MKKKLKLSLAASLLAALAMLFACTDSPTNEIDASVSQATLNVLVKDSLTGGVISEASVKLLSTGTAGSTSETGTLAFAGVPSGSHTLLIEKRGYAGMLLETNINSASTEANVASGNSVIATLNPLTSSLDGYALFPSNGGNSPAKGAVVRLQLNEGNCYSSVCPKYAVTVYETTVGEDGKFAFDSLPAIGNSYSLSLMAYTSADRQEYQARSIDTYNYSINTGKKTSISSSISYSNGALLYIGSTTMKVAVANKTTPIVLEFNDEIDKVLFKQNQVGFSSSYMGLACFENWERPPYNYEYRALDHYCDIYPYDFVFREVLILGTLINFAADKTVDGKKITITPLGAWPESFTITVERGLKSKKGLALGQAVNISVELETEKKPLGAMTLLTAVPQATPVEDNSIVNLTWNKVAEATSYKVFVRSTTLNKGEWVEFSRTSPSTDTTERVSLASKFALPASGKLNVDFLLQACNSNECTLLNQADKKNAKTIEIDASKRPPVYPVLLSAQFCYGGSCDIASKNSSGQYTSNMLNTKFKQAIDGTSNPGDYLGEYCFEFDKEVTYNSFQTFRNVSPSFSSDISDYLTASVPSIPYNTRNFCVGFRQSYVGAVETNLDDYSVEYSITGLRNDEGYYVDGGTGDITILMEATID